MQGCGNELKGGRAGFTIEIDVRDADTWKLKREDCPPVPRND